MIPQSSKCSATALAALCAALAAAIALRAPPPPPLPPLAAPPSAPAELRARLRDARVLVISHDASASGAPRVCVEMAQALADLGAAVSLAVQGRAVVRRADREALVSLLGGGAAAFAVVGLTPREVRDADFVIVSTAVASNSAWIAAAAAMPPAPPPSGMAGVADALLDLAAIATGASRTSARHVRPNARLVWLVHESGAVMRALGRGATDAAVAAMSDPRGRVDSVVFVSHAARAWWLEEVQRQHASASALRPSLVLHWGVPRWKLELLASPERAADARVRLRRQLGFDEADFVFLVVGSFHPMKGHAGIVRAFLDAQAACPRVDASVGRRRLVAVGGGFGAAGYFPREFADAENVLTLSDVRLLPSTSDVAAFFAMADVAVSNTQGPGETWGLATLEALAAGKAVLAAGNGGTLEQLQHNETALLHPGSDAGSGDPSATLSERPRRLFADVAAPSELVRHMCAVATDTDLFARLRAAGSAHVRRALSQDHIDSVLTAMLA